jgi:hypothetical protein
MSVSTEVQRTLVKSPPELWAELSDPEALARHLAELGEIRITGVEPETKVEWEAEDASGVVHLKQSGWGTKVTLSLTREAPEPEASPEPGPEPLAEAPPELEQVAEPIAGEPEPEPIAEEPEPEPIAEEPEPEPIAEEPEPEPIAEEPEPKPIAVEQPKPRRRLFARLFRRRSIAQVAPAAPVEPEPIAEPEPVAVAVAVVEPEPEPLAAPEPIYPLRQAEPVEDLAAELASVEAQMAQETTELLTGVLDRLGAAHHRPFSRG